MALVRCPDCSKDISDAAANCIHCGRPLKTAHPPVQTVELTSKRYKGQQVAGVVALCFGLFIVLASGGNGAGAAIGGLLFVGGLVFWIGGRVGAWWHHS